MLIDEILEEECRSILAEASCGRLGCTLNNQPYIVPL